MKRKILLVLFIAVTGLCNTIAQENWVSFTKATPEEPTVALQQSNTSAVVFNVQTPGMYATEITNGGVIISDLGCQSKSAPQLRDTRKFRLSGSLSPSLNAMK